MTVVEQRSEVYQLMHHTWHVNAPNSMAMYFIQSPLKSASLLGEARGQVITIHPLGAVCVLFCQSVQLLHRDLSPLQWWTLLPLQPCLKHCLSAVWIRYSLQQQLPHSQFSSRAQHAMHRHKGLPARCVVSVSLFDRSCSFRCSMPTRSLCLFLFLSCTQRHLPHYPPSAFRLLCVIWMDWE